LEFTPNTENTSNFKVGKIVLSVLGVTLLGYIGVFQYARINDDFRKMLHEKIPWGKQIIPEPPMKTKSIESKSIVKEIPKTESIVSQPNLIPEEISKEQKVRAL
jgi:hypothetical protein